MFTWWSKSLSQEVPELLPSPQLNPFQGFWQVQFCRNLTRLGCRANTESSAETITSWDGLWSVQEPESSDLVDWVVCLDAALRDWQKVIWTKRFVYLSRQERRWMLLLLLCSCKVRLKLDSTTLDTVLCVVSGVALTVLELKSAQTTTHTLVAINHLILLWQWVAVQLKLSFAWNNRATIENESEWVCECVIQPSAEINPERTPAACHVQLFNQWKQAGRKWTNRAQVMIKLWFSGSSFMALWGLTDGDHPASRARKSMENRTNFQASRRLSAGAGLETLCLKLQIYLH